MARAFGVDLRERVLGAAEEGISVRRAAARFEVKISTAIVWVRRFRESGETAARKQGKPRGSKLDSHEAFLLGLVKAHPDITLEEMREALLRDRSFEVSLATIWRFFDIDFGVYGVPETFVIAGDGRITYRYPGPLSPEIIAEKIMPAIKKIEQETAASRS